MDKIVLSAKSRTSTGKKVSKLLHTGLIPANIFGKSIQSQSIEVDATAFNSVYEQAGETQVIYLNLEGESSPRPVLVSSLQLHPLTEKILHIDFRQVNLREKVTANIPLLLVGESPAVKELQAVIISNFTEIEVEALPTNLPENIEVDISNLKQVGDTIKVSDLVLNREIIDIKEDPETILVSTTEQQKEEEIPVTEAPAETPATTEAAAASTEPKKE